MVPPLIGRNGCSGERSIIILHVRDKDVQTADKSFDVEQEVRSLLVGDLTVALIRYEMLANLQVRCPATQNGAYGPNLVSLQSSNGKSNRQLTS